MEKALELEFGKKYRVGNFIVFKYNKVLRKSAFWEQHRDTEINERQRKVINRLWDGFEGKLTTQKYAKINHCSQDTALRDIQSLITKNILRKTDEGGRSTNYELVEK